MEKEILIILFIFLTFLNIIFSFIQKKEIENIEEKIYQLNEKKFNEDLVNLIEDKIEEKINLNKYM